MGTVPTGRMEREMRKYYLEWVKGLPSHTDDAKDLEKYTETFKSKMTNIIEDMGGDVSRLGVAEDFPAPKRLDLSPHVGTVYSEIDKAAIQAGISIGLNARDTALSIMHTSVNREYYKVERLARTETVSAYWKNQWDEVEGLDLVMVWSPEKGSRTCDICLSKDGLVVADSSIRDHPNGRCTLVPMLPSMVKYKGTLQRDGSVTQELESEWNPMHQEQTQPPVVEQVPEEDRYAGYADLSVDFSPITINKFARRAFPDVRDFSKDIVESVEIYTGDMYSPINDNLRRGVSPAGITDRRVNLPETINNLDKALDRSIVSKNIVVHRKVGLDAFGADIESIVGKTVQDKGFMSTSLSDSAYSLSGDHVNMVIRVPQGSNALWASPASAYKDEYEVLLPRNTKLKVISAERREEGWMLEVDVIQ